MARVVGTVVVLYCRRWWRVYPSIKAHGKVKREDESTVGITARIMSTTCRRIVGELRA